MHAFVDFFYYLAVKLESSAQLSGQECDIQITFESYLSSSVREGGGGAALVAVHRLATPGVCSTD